MAITMPIIIELAMPGIFSNQDRDVYCYPIHDQSSNEKSHPYYLPDKKTAERTFEAIAINISDFDPKYSLDYLPGFMLFTYSIGKVNQNVDPLPSSLSTPISPL